jgi:hypothetical protein
VKGLILISLSALTKNEQKPTPHVLERTVSKLGRLPNVRKSQVEDFPIFDKAHSEERNEVCDFRKASSPTRLYISLHCNCVTITASYGIQ